MCSSVWSWFNIISQEGNTQLQSYRMEILILQLHTRGQTQVCMKTMKKLCTEMDSVATMEKINARYCI